MSILRIRTTPNSRSPSPLGRAGVAQCRGLIASRSIVAWCGLAAWSIVGGAAAIASDVDFNRDVRPILAAHCLACHGPDEASREADLRLDQRASAVADRGGSAAVVPGDPEASELLRRVTSDDEFERMPPPEAGAPLSAQQIEVLSAWIAAGATVQRHWAFVPPERPALPRPSTDRPSTDRPSDDMPARDWPRNAIDFFVLARMQQASWQPAAEADRYALVRRVYLDLIGVPPTPAAADAFVDDPDPLAYERLVDRLLASPEYGQRWARRWLDLARYADTNGYEKDRPRSIWPYRDWVVRSLNQDLPFDRFSIEQLAGDMLPDAGPSQRIATGFHRNTMLNEEGGIDPLEYRFHAMVDRVAVTGTVWLGLTTGCAQCHSHKYDPISHTDYYQLMALLNNADEPEMRVRDAAIVAQRDALQAEIAQLEAGLADQFPPAEGTGPLAQRRADNLAASFTQWLATARERAVDWQVLRPVEWTSNLPRLEVLADGSIFSSGDITKRDLFALTFRGVSANSDSPSTSNSPSPVGVPPGTTALRIEVLPDERLPAGGPGRSYYEGRKGDFFLSEVTATADGRPLPFSGASHSYGKISIGSGDAKATNVIDGEGSTGWSTAEREGEPHQLVLVLAEPLAEVGDLRIELLFERHFAASLGRFRLSATTAADGATASELPVDIEQTLTQAPDSWSDDQQARMRSYYLSIAPELADARQRIDDLRARLPEPPTTLVMQERPADSPRPTFRHHRGEYLQPRERVEPSLPALFRDGIAAASGADDPGEQAAQTGDANPSASTTTVLESAPTNRLEFAQWLASRQNPLVGRITVNRAWRDFFGHGLMRTSGDFGTQSDAPTHPQLLDWLAVEFTTPASAGGLDWSLKRLHRLIVTSATYRQSSQVDAELLERDLQNRLLARGPRFRLDAEKIRDSMLQSSGLLSSKMGGPSLYPPQPKSVASLAYGNTGWPVSQGEDRYRRSLYTFSKRTAPFAAYAVFDGPSGEICLARRDRSNTPLQALTLLNDAMFLEMAQALARIAVGASESPDDRATVIFRRLLTRPPSDWEREALLQFQRTQHARLASGDLPGREIAGAANIEREDAVAISAEETAELASWVMVARAVMNLDEAVTKP